MKNNILSKLLIVSVFSILFFTFASCAHVEPVQECLKGERYGLLFGLLHGFITPFSFIASLFDDNVAVYAVNNTGGWYDFGFLLGSGGWGVLAGNKSKRKS